MGVAVAGVGLLLTRRLAIGDGESDATGEVPCEMPEIPVTRHASERRPLPVGLWRWAQLSLLLALQNTLEIASIPRLGNDNLAPILQQASVPLTFSLSCLLLRKCYGCAHLAGAGLIVAGVSVGFLPTFVSPGGASSTSSSEISAAWVGVFLLSRLPQALANVLAEGSLSGRPHVSWAFRATFYTQVLGLPCNLLSAFVLAFAEHGNAGSVWEDYTQGSRCLFLQGRGLQIQEGGQDSAICATAWQSVLLFAVPGALFTLSEFQVLQRASATTYFLLAALQLPVQDTLLSMPAVMGDLHSAFHLSFIPAIAIVGIGLWIYGCANAPGQPGLGSEVLLDFE